THLAGAHGADLTDVDPATATGRAGLRLAQDAVRSRHGRFRRVAWRPAMPEHKKPRGSLLANAYAVKRVLKAGTADVPVSLRREKAAPYEPRIRDLYARCDGNLVRVCEELAQEGIVLPYPTRTGFCRRHGIGQEPKERTGQYVFEPGRRCNTTL